MPVIVIAIAMTDIEPRNWNYYTMYIRSVIHGMMQEMGYAEEQIGLYFKTVRRYNYNQKLMVGNRLVALTEW